MSEIRANTISAANGTDPVTLTKQKAAKALCRVDQTGTQNFDISFNCSSLTDNTTGSTTVTVTNAFSSADSFQMSGAMNTSRYNFSSGTASASTFNLSVRKDDSTFVDTDQVSGIAFGDLA